MKSIVLLSSGLDSTVNFCKALRETRIIKALTFDYGQRAACREILAAEKLCRLWRIPHKIIKLPWLGKITNTALVNRKSVLPVASGDSSLALRMTGQKSAKAVWVPNRNGLFINIAASFAESFEASIIITGFNKEEAVTFPDNSQKFVNIINKTLRWSTLKHPKVVSFTQSMKKVNMVKYAILHRLPLYLCWPCYKGGLRLCLKCESCRRFISAFEEIS